MLSDQRDLHICLCRRYLGTPNAKQTITQLIARHLYITLPLLAPRFSNTQLLYELVLVLP